MSALPLSFGVYYKFSCSNWKYKKETILDILSNVNYTRSSDDCFWSDRMEPRNYVSDFLSLFKNEIKTFAEEIGREELSVSNIWSVKYDYDDYHVVHNHNAANYSAILYLDYDKEIHSPTYYIENDFDPYLNSTLIRSLDAEEGDIVFFPASLMHFTRPQKTEIQKKIISFDVRL